MTYQEIPTFTTRRTEMSGGAQYEPFALSPDTGASRWARSRRSGLIGMMWLRTRRKWQ
jgi:hypothetical protein